MRIAFIALSLLAAAPLAQAEGNGDHPAIVARRVIAAQGYDYASAFYAHPAGLRLASTAPAATAEQPAVVATARTATESRRATHRAAARK
jgi:hypothetical protein